MAYEGYGVRARFDLSANYRPSPEVQVAAGNVVKVARMLEGELQKANGDKRGMVCIGMRFAQRVINALLEVEHLQAIEKAGP